MAEAGDRLRRLLGGDETAWLVDRARRRLERGRPLTGTVTLAAGSAAQRRAVELLLGRRAGAGASLSVSLDEVDRVLRASAAAPGGLEEAVVRLRGPIRDLAGEHETRAAAWRAAFAPLDTLITGRPRNVHATDHASVHETDRPDEGPATDHARSAHETDRPDDGPATDRAGSVHVTGRPELGGWRSWLDSTGLVRRLAPTPDEARPLLEALAGVLARLPSPGLPIGRLAAESAGDAHALDEGRPLATLALSAVRGLAGLPYAGESGADARRAAWAAVGVHLDDLSSLVLCLGLTGDDRTTTGRMLAAARAAGEPCVLTLRQLRRHEAPLSTDLVRICENPVVVAAAADELGAACPPLVCAGGRPSAAVWRLIDLLAAGGAEFAYHGDFDWGGIAIAAAVHERTGFRPWRFDTLSYEAASSTTPLTGRPAATPWDPALADAMTRRAVRVEEELVLADLLGDLAGA